ncbi:hypothetical protein [Dokdonella soli]|uniref:Uncharacterized protein n=1 Tax=Dokdonella soli TaxID=529810 RepID=A0ABN1IC17_9GAMM
MRHVPSAAGISVVAAFGAALALSWLVLLLWAARVDAGSPLVATTELSLPGSRFHAVFGSANPEAQRLRVDAAAADFSALQSTALANIAAGDFPILRYRFDEFPRTLELSLVFRTAEAPDDVQSISLPRIDRREAVFDLSQIPSWKGTITELGFAEFPTAQLVPPVEGFRPFVLVGAQLESLSWRGRLEALISAWHERRPWQLISVSAVGPAETGDSSPHSPRLPLMLALGLLPIGIFGWAILRLRGKALRRLLFVGTACAWIVCDLAWQRDLAYKRATDRDIWGNAPLAARQDRVPDAELRDVALHIRSTLAGMPSSTRVLVGAPTPYAALRLIYHAAPLNIGVLAGADVERAAAGTIVVRYADDQDEVKNGVLQFGGMTMRVRTIEQRPDLGVYAITAVLR